jgi:hypothetical protein
VEDKIKKNSEIYSSMCFKRSREYMFSWPFFHFQLNAHYQRQPIRDGRS